MKNNPLLTAAGLGVIGGMRSMMPLAIISKKFTTSPSLALSQSYLSFIQSKNTVKLLALAASGELLGDKSAKAPDRIETKALLFRVASGAVSGAAIYKAAYKNPYHGALIGAAAAFVSTHLSFYARKRLIDGTDGRNKTTGLLEDLLVIGLAKLI